MKVTRRLRSPAGTFHKVMAQCVCSACPSRELALGQPPGISPLSAGVTPAAGASSQKAREPRSSAARRAFKGRHGWVFAEMPGYRSRGNATRSAPVVRNRSGFRHPSLCGTAGRSPASRPSAKFRAACCTAKVGRENTAVPTEGEAEDGIGGRAGRGSVVAEGGTAQRRAHPAPSPRNLGTLRGLAPCLRGCVSPGSVTKAWKPQYAHPRRNLPTGSAFSASSEETNRQKNKLLVPLQNRVHQVSEKEPSLAFTIHSPHYRRSKGASGRAGAARMTCQSNPFQLQEHNLNPGSPPLSELSMLLVSRSSPFLLKPRLEGLGS